MHMMNERKHRFKIENERVLWNMLIILRLYRSVTVLRVCFRTLGECEKSDGKV